jgi:hypothetical protein
MTGIPKPKMGGNGTVTPPSDKQMEGKPETPKAETPVTHLHQHKPKKS